MCGFLSTPRYNSHCVFGHKGHPEDSRGLRGGSWYNNQDNVRAAYRNNNTANNRNNNVGFRLVCGRVPHLVPPPQVVRVISALATGGHATIRVLPPVYARRSRLAGRGGEKEMAQGCPVCGQNRRYGYNCLPQAHTKPRGWLGFAPASPVPTPTKTNTKTLKVLETFRVLFYFSPANTS
jgi:hypothetical protein